MQVHGDDVVGARGLQHIGDQPRRDGGAGLVLLILPGVGVAGYDGGDASCTGGLAGVDHDQQLHEAVVDVARGGGLEDVDIFVAYGLADGDGCFLVGVIEGCGASNLYAEPGGWDVISAAVQSPIAVYQSNTEAHLFATRVLSSGWLLPLRSLISFAIPLDIAIVALLQERGMGGVGESRALARKLSSVARGSSLRGDLAG